MLDRLLLHVVEDLVVGELADAGDHLHDQLFDGAGSVQLRYRCGSCRDPDPDATR
jgi:hypothetical protein